MNITRFLYSTNSEMIVFRWTRDANRSYKLSKGCEVWVIVCWWFVGKRMWQHGRVAFFGIWNCDVHSFLALTSFHVFCIFDWYFLEEVRSGFLHLWGQLYKWFRSSKLNILWPRLPQLQPSAESAWLEFDGKVSHLFECQSSKQRTGRVSELSDKFEVCCVLGMLCLYFLCLFGHFAGSG